MTALIAQHATHRRDPADPAQLRRVPNGRGSTRTVPCPGVARLLTTMVTLLQQRRRWSERELAEEIDADCHQVHRLLVAADDDGWILRSWPGHDEGADEGARMSRSYYTICVPSWIERAAIEAAQREAQALARGRGAAPSAVIRDTGCEPSCFRDVSLVQCGPEPERADSAEGSAAIQLVDDLAPTSAAGAPTALTDPAAPSAALMAALAVLSDLPRLHAHPAYTRDGSHRGLGNVDLLTTDLAVRTTVITGSVTFTVGDLAGRTSLSRGSLRSSLRSLADHQIVDRLSRTTWSITQTDVFGVLDGVADRLGLHAVREHRRIAHQQQREGHWERLILHSMMPSDRVREQIRRMGYEVPEHLASLKSYEEQADERCRNEAPYVVSLQAAAHRPTREYVLRRPEPVDVDRRPCLLDLGQLKQRLDALAVEGLSSPAITKAITGVIVELAREQGLKVRREVPVPVYRLVGRRDQRVWQQLVDLVISLPGSPPLYIEIDRAEKRESRRKLRWAVSQGYDAIWIRWGGSRDVAVVDDGVRVVEPSWRRTRRHPGMSYEAPLRGVE